VLLPALGIDWVALATDPAAPEQADYRNTVRTDFAVRVAGRMASFYLLPALGMCLALRCGAIDLSVWAVAAMGGVLAAVAVNAGWPPAWAFAAAAAAGLGAGAVNGALVAFARLPAPLVTLVTGGLLMFAVQAGVKGEAVSIPGDTFLEWAAISDAPEGEAPDGEAPQAVFLSPPMLRMGVVVLSYAVVLVALLAVDLPGTLGGRRHRAPPGQAARFAALCASGALCGLAGAVWLIEHGAAPVLARPVGDLRIPAAAVLAGAAFFAGRGRALLVALCLPGALLLAGIWQREVWVWDLRVDVYPLQTLLLVAMGVATHVAMAKALCGRRRLTVPAAGLCAAGMLLCAASALVRGFDVRAAFYIAGLAVFGLGAAMLVTAFATRGTRGIKRHRGTP